MNTLITRVIKLQNKQFDINNEKMTETQLNKKINKELVTEFRAKEKKLGNFEKYLPIWVAVCIIIGIILSQLFPFLSTMIDLLKIGPISIPIGVCLFLMMYPAMLNLQFSELKKLGKNPKPIILTLVSNWIIAPFIGLLMANIFLQGHPQLIIAIILLSSSPCTAMVLVWGWLARGNQEQNVINTSLNTITIIFLYTPLVSLLTGIQNIPINQWLLIISLIFFIGLPLILGLTSKRFLISSKGEKWFEDIYRPAVGKISIVALLSTLIVLFTLNGDVLLKNPTLLLLITIPLLVGFAIVLGYNILITRLFRLKYKKAIITVIIGSSSHFEIAIATAVAMFGVGSIAALGTTMGLFWEVPVMLSMVYLGRYLGKINFWKSESEIHK